jgi:hypothetical protein
MITTRTVFLIALALTAPIAASAQGFTRAPLRGKRTAPSRRLPFLCAARTPSPQPTAAEPLPPEPVAEPPALSNGRTIIEGVLPAIALAPVKAQMINPFAPAEYGSARNFVVYTERDPIRTSNQNKNRFQPDGIRFLTVRPLW